MSIFHLTRTSAPCRGGQEHHAVFALNPPQPLKGWCPDCENVVATPFNLHATLTIDNLAASRQQARDSVNPK